ncbi:L-ascorbate oxidase [Scenedesmus sp. PABB004]|nr:L-ascorbate oxidase [Scenedesmus sp. PABB004]
MDVTAGTLAPDCVSRKVVLVNGEFQPQITLVQGEWVAMTVKNNLPADWPSISSGITIHWHGFGMRGHPWMDGTRYVSQCPIARGASFTYKFQVNEMPGTYFWHGHAQMNRADGLQGPLVVRTPDSVPALTPADGTSVLFLQDWWHSTGNSMAMRLNRPFDPTKVINASATSDGSGAWCWIGLPKSLLVNGKGNYHQCEDVYKRKARCVALRRAAWRCGVQASRCGAAASRPRAAHAAPAPRRGAQENETLPFRTDGYKAAAKDLLTPNGCVAGQLGPTAEQPACSVGYKPAGVTCAGREVFSVKPGTTRRFRIINAAMLLYMTVCFEKHDVTVVALDAAPVAPKTFSQCVDVNTGQRVDVLLKANQPVGRYWISVASQYRKGAPATYAVLQYEGSTTPPNPVTALQPGPAVDLKWNTSVMMGFAPHPELLAADAAKRPKSAAFLAPKAQLPSFALPSGPVTKRVLLYSTQPLVEANGVLRWAFDNIAHAVSPPCKPLLDLVYADPGWAAANALDAKATGLDPALYFTKMGGDAATWTGEGKKVQVVDAAGPNADIVVKLKPGAGTHVLTVKRGEVVEIVIQNLRAGANGGEYNTTSPLTSARNGREQHSFHTHGHHAWQVGMGMGAWSPELVGGPSYSATPVLRDTVTVLFNGTTEDAAAWVAIRFVADNTGVWPLHCHIAAHELMGQGIAIIEDPEGIAAATVPPGMPQCPGKCYYSNANFNPKATQAVWGASGLLAPETNTP